MQEQLSPHSNRFQSDDLAAPFLQASFSEYAISIDQTYLLQDRGRSLVGGRLSSKPMLLIARDHPERRQEPLCLLKSDCREK
jgi:hypothetical protein